MKQLMEFLPVVLFFVVYQMDGDTVSVGNWSHQVDGIFSATAVLMAATALQVALSWLLFRELEKRLLWTGLAVIIFGSATLLLRDETFIQWKPTVFNWGMALAFAGSQFIGARNLLERLMGAHLALPARIWSRLCWIWVAHFSVVGALNLVVAYRFEEATWVAYKLYSGIGFTVLIMIITALVIGPWIKQDSTQRDVADSEFRP